jgi:hypothetical protein
MQCDGEPEGRWEEQIVDDKKDVVRDQRRNDRFARRACLVPLGMGLKSRLDRRREPKAFAPL